MVVGLFSAQNVEIPDTAFLYALIDEGVDTNGDSLISYAEAEVVTSIDIAAGCDGPWNCDDRITSLVGIEAFVNLETLNCSGNELTSLDVSECTALAYLDCSSNTLTSLDVSGCHALTYLDCSRNELLYEICVWESFPAGVTFIADHNPFAYPTTECGTFTTIRYIRFGSTGDPLNGLTVTWKSNGTSDSIAWGYTTDLERGVYPGLKRNGAIGTMFDYTYPSLTAASIIHYVLFDSQDSVWTEEKTFNTASDPSNNQFSFSALGDSRRDMNQWQIVSEAVLETDFTLFLGDIVDNGGELRDWYVWFAYGENFISREPVYHTIGNHDGGDFFGGDDFLTRYDNYLNMFTLPGNELYYSFTYGNAVFICLNSDDAGNIEQFFWLLETLEANKNQTWKIVFFHIPFFTSTSQESEMDYYFNTWWKAFDDYRVDLILNGHTHNYQRTSPIDRNISTTSPVDIYGSLKGMGRCQIVSGGAGENLAVAANPVWWLCRSESKHHFCNIDIDGDIMKIKAIDVNHVVFDEFIIDKRWTGISDFRSTGSWIYPNPANNFLTLQLKEYGAYSIEIISMNGQIIQRRNFTDRTHQIDLSSLLKGVYFITIRSKDFVTTEKFIKL
jgi:hypothetical protein